MDSFLKRGSSKTILRSQRSPDGRVRISQNGVQRVIREDPIPLIHQLIVTVAGAREIASAGVFSWKYPRQAVGKPGVRFAIEGRWRNRRSEKKP